MALRSMTTAAYHRSQTRNLRTTFRCCVLLHLPAPEQTGRNVSRTTLTERSIQRRLDDLLPVDLLTPVVDARATALYTLKLDYGSDNTTLPSALLLPSPPPMPCRCGVAVWLTQADFPNNSLCLVAFPPMARAGVTKHRNMAEHTTTERYRSSLPSAFFLSAMRPRGGTVRRDATRWAGPGIPVCRKTPVSSDAITLPTGCLLVRHSPSPVQPPATIEHTTYSFIAGLPARALTVQFVCVFFGIPVPGMDISLTYDDRQPVHC